MYIQIIMVVPRRFHCVVNDEKKFIYFALNPKRGLNDNLRILFTQ
jgi:hypothetical protein